MGLLSKKFIDFNGDKADTTVVLTKTIEHSMMNMTRIPAAIIIPIPQSGNIETSEVSAGSLMYTRGVVPDVDVTPDVTTEMPDNYKFYKIPQAINVRIESWLCC